MAAPDRPHEVATIDQLLTRSSADQLPTPLDPTGPEARGYPADPKPVPRRGQGESDETNLSPQDIGRSA